MSSYKRFFRIDEGPLLAEIQQLEAQRLQAIESLEAFCKIIGADTFMVYGTGGLAGFVFKTDPDPGAWKKTGRHGLYVPRRNTTAGKALDKQVKDLPRVPSIHEAVKVLGMDHIFPPLSGEGGGGVCCIQGFLSGPIFLIVPWLDVAPQSLVDYRAEKASGKRFSSMYEHLMWTPTPDLVEVKEWEMLKAIDEKREQVKEGEGA